MAPTINIDTYSDALVVLGTAGLAVPIVRRLGLSPILAYLGAGAVLGPLGVGSFIQSFPFLYWFTVVDAQNVAGIAELGVVFLLFLIGLELSFRRLLTMRRLVFGLGTLQISISAALLAAAAAMAGLNSAAAVIVGASLSLSSTAIVLELLSKQGRLSATVGRASFSVLLAQDIAVIPILVFVSVVAIEGGGSVIATLASALLQVAIAISFIILFGRLLLRPLFQFVADTHSAELFVAAVLFVIIGAGVVAHQAGLSMALGAFVAGLMLAETEYGKAIQTVIGPFKGLLLGIFFFTVGMNIDFREFAREPFWLLAAVVCLIAVKSLVLAILARLFQLSWPAAVETGLLLGPGGEFAFVIIGMGSAAGLIEPKASSFVLAATSATMALTPLLATGARHLSSVIAVQPTIDSELTVRPPSDETHAIVVGYGRVGKAVCSMLKQHGISYIAVDYDPYGVARDRRDGHAVYYGDASDPSFLETCGLMHASGVVITIQTRSVIDKVVNHVRATRPEMLIVSRARDADHACHLYAIGASDAVPETVEASFQLSEAALVGLGISTEAAIASTHEKRDQFRRALQQASRQAGRPPPENESTHGSRGR